MTKDLLRKRDVKGHQEDGPIYGMEADYVLADEVKVSRPVFLVEFTMVPVDIITQTRDIV
jgi:hypothetical protein